MDSAAAIFFGSLLCKKWGIALKYLLTLNEKAVSKETASLKKNHCEFIANGLQILRSFHLSGCTYLQFAMQLLILREKLAQYPSQEN